jgi:hypothetical protein
MLILMKSGKMNSIQILMVKQRLAALEHKNENLQNRRKRLSKAVEILR